MRHKLSEKKIIFKDAALQALIKQAEELEANGKWFPAAEHCLKLASTNKNRSPLYLEIAQTFVRAATFFELAGQQRDAGRAYFEAASILHNNKIDCIVAGELFNRAAFNFRAVSEYFNAGDSYMRAARAFADSQVNTIQTDDNIPPVPSCAGKYTIAGNCFNAAAEAFCLANNLAWARSTYWQAGQMHTKQGHGYHAYLAFRKALAMCIRFDHTLDPEHLRKALPMTKEEREEKINPINILEQSAYNGNKSHQQINTATLDENWTKCTTIEQMISAFHEFYLEFNKISNLKGAKRLYIKEKKKQRELFFNQKNYLAGIGLVVWDLTCEYGESFPRWLATCFVLLIVFSVLYASFGLIEPVSGWGDYFYFSAVTFTTLGYGDIHPLGPIGKMFASIEAGLGFLMLGLLLTFLGRRMSS